MLADGLVLEFNKVVVVATESTGHTVLFHKDTVRFVEEFKTVAKLQVVLESEWFWDNNTAELVDF